ncbi:hypothetical protein GBAR_LOCUS1653 [Geodia barretti]|uniref:Uncharacterized protein n=1 Tax=Geodia barretti TaxID=519541 RepID=A0AA35QX66_GEOBA|nr:hypothetical protein GBAR_LOCUS1653 [Geodia barretti]
MRLRSVPEKHPGAGILWTGVTGKVYYIQPMKYEIVAICRSIISCLLEGQWT